MHIRVFTVIFLSMLNKIDKYSITPEAPHPHQHSPPCLSPELSQVVVPGLAVRGASDAHGEARLELPQLQQDDGQIVDEEQSVHQGHGVLHNSLVVLILGMMFV